MCWDKPRGPLAYPHFAFRHLCSLAFWLDAVSRSPSLWVLLVRGYACLGARCDPPLVQPKQIHDIRDFLQKARR